MVWAACAAMREGGALPEPHWRPSAAGHASHKAYADLSSRRRAFAQCVHAARHGARHRRALWHVRHRRRLHPDAVSDLPRCASWHRRRHGSEPSGGGFGFQRAWPLATGQCRPAHGASPGRGRLSWRLGRRQGALLAARLGAARPGGGPDLRHFIGCRRRADADRERQGLARVARQARQLLASRWPAWLGRTACR